MKRSERSERESAGCEAPAAATANLPDAPVRQAGTANLHDTPVVQAGSEVPAAPTGEHRRPRPDSAKAGARPRGACELGACSRSDVSPLSQTAAESAVDT